MAKTVKDLRGLSAKELQELLQKLRAEASQLLLELRSNDSQNHANYKRHRKQIAQINTVLAETK